MMSILCNKPCKSPGIINNAHIPRCACSLVLLSRYLSLRHCVRSQNVWVLRRWRKIHWHVRVLDLLHSTTGLDENGEVIEHLPRTPRSQDCVRVKIKFEMHDSLKMVLELGCCQDSSIIWESMTCSVWEMVLLAEVVDQLT